MIVPMTIDTQLSGARKLGNSISGNPVWELVTSSGTYRTEPDSQVNFLVSEALVDRMRHQKVRLTMTPKYRVIGIEGIER